MKHYIVKVQKGNVVKENVFYGIDAAYSFFDKMADTYGCENVEMIEE